MSEEKTTGEPLINLSDKTIREYAMDLAQGRMILSTQVPQDLWFTVFLPLLFLKDIPENLDIIYAKMENAGPRVVNGFPIFSTIGMLNKHDGDRLLGYAKRFKKSMDKMAGITDSSQTKEDTDQVDLFNNHEQQPEQNS